MGGCIGRRSGLSGSHGVGAAEGGVWMRPLLRVDGGRPVRCGHNAYIIHVRIRFRSRMSPGQIQEAPATGTARRQERLLSVILYKYATKGDIQHLTKK
jgi:hypothetical protein